MPQVHVLCTKGGRGPPGEREREEENEIVDYTVEVPTREREEELRKGDFSGHCVRKQKQKGTQVLSWTGVCEDRN